MRPNFEISSASRTAKDECLAKMVDEVQAQMVRVDTKSAMLFAVSGTALTVGVATLARVNLPIVAAIAGWLAVGLIAVAVVSLGMAVRPMLKGDHGFIRYARAESIADLVTVAERISADEATYRSTQLLFLSKAVRRKYRRVQVAVDLLMAGLAATLLTALLSILL